MPGEGIDYVHSLCSKDNTEDGSINVDLTEDIDSCDFTEIIQAERQMITLISIGIINLRILKIMS
jgi:hypothetical protein